MPQPCCNFLSRDGQRASHSSITSPERGAAPEPMSRMLLRSYFFVKGDFAKAWLPSVIYRNRGGDTYDNDGRHHSQGSDAVFLDRFQHLDEIKFLHDVHGNTANQCSGNEDRLSHGMIEREEAKPLPALVSASHFVEIMGESH
jgi:hypothetical protein